MQLGENAVKKLVFISIVFALTISCLIDMHPAGAQVPGVTEFLICTNSSFQGNPVIDGDIVVWLDERNGHGHLYGYDLSTSTEFPVCTIGYQQGLAGISGDIIVWEELRNGTNDIYGYNISSGSEFPICTEPTMPQMSPAISGDIVVWEDERSGDDNGNIYAYNLSNGSTFTVCTNLSDQEFPSVSEDIVVWTDHRNGNSDIYGYNLSSGVEFPICTNASIQMGPDISGNIVVWTDSRNGNQDIYGYNLSSGIEFPICTNSSNQWNAAISGDTVVWYDSRWEEGYSDVYGYNLSSCTEFPVVDAPSGQYCPDISGDVVVWFDYRNGNGDIYGATLNWTPPSVVWVDDDYNASSCGGHTWEYDAFSKIQAGIDNVSSTGTVHVAAGTYHENIVLKDGVELLGAGSVSTIINGMQNGSVVTATNVSNVTKIDGFTVTNGSGTNTVIFGDETETIGGGMYNNNSSLTISNCTLKNNSAYEGGGMYNLNSSPTLTNCILDNNRAFFFNGGGMYNANSSTILTNCLFINNIAAGCVAGGCPITRHGGGMFTCSSQSFYCSICGGMPIVTNCIFWNNSVAGDDPEISGPANVTYSNVEGGYTGTGNINSNPLFANAAAGDFHLTTGSPCIDAGNNSAPSLPTTDFDGNRRIVDGDGSGTAIVDMGAYEYVPTPTGFYGDANRDGKLSILDYSSVQLMRFGQLPFNPGADANRDGLLSILDYSSVQLMRFGQYPNISKYEVRYDFTSGNGSNKWAKNSSITAPPPALNKIFETDAGWTNATTSQYNNISSTDGIVWNISGTSDKYAAMQCKFTIAGAAANITSIGVTLNGSAKTNGDVLQLWAWNFSSGSWKQLGIYDSTTTNFSMTTSIATYSAWTAWGKVYTNYIDGNGYMYILADLNNPGENLYVDYIKLTTVQP
jgi:TolB protein